jgi:hypothetical protein
VSKTYWDKGLSKKEKRIILSYLYLIKTKSAQQIETEGWLTPHQLDSLDITVSRVPDWLYGLSSERLSLEVLKYGGPFKWI